MVPARNTRLILSVDDDEDAHLLLRRAFAKASASASLIQLQDGTDVIAYLNGQEPYSDRTKFPIPDLLLLDLKMRQVSGFEVLEFLRNNPQLRTFKVIVFSSSDNPVDVERACALGCDSYVVKPSDFAALVQLVKSFQKEGSLPESQRPSGTSPEINNTALPQPAQPSMNSPRKLEPVKPVNPVDSPDVFSLLVDQVKDYAIFVLDREGYVRSWNEGARRIQGYEASEIIGKHLSVFYPHSDLDSDKPGFELRMAIDMERYEDEGWRIRKYGSRFWANVIVSPLRAANGEITGFAKVTRDLTQRKLQEEHLQRLLDSEERFRLLVEQVKDYAIFFLDARGNISSWNQGARRIKGYTADEIIGRHFSTFYTEEDLATDKPSRELIIAVREGRYEEEGWRLRKDGTRFWASVVITALWDKRGNLSGFAKVTRDLTERKRKEEALTARTADLEAFAHTLSHDLRAPLRSISSFAEVLIKEETELDAAQRNTYLQKIVKAATGMEWLIRDILKLSEVTLAPSAEELVRLDEVLSEALRFLEADINRSKAEIQIRTPLPLIRGNRTLVFQIFTNLLANAVKFSRPGEPPKVEIYSIPRETGFEVHVKDSGCGIPAHVQRSIFDTFNRGTAAENYAGSGIGLAIVKKAVERVGGNVSVISKEGEGTDFIVVLPCEKPTSAPISSVVAA